MRALNKDRSSGRRRDRGRALDGQRPGAAPTAAVARATGRQHPDRDRPAAQRSAGNVPGRRWLGGAGELQCPALGLQRHDPDQVWSFNPMGEVNDVLTGQCLDAAGYEGTKGVHVDTFRCEGLDDQRWVLTPRGPGVFELHNLKRGLCLDVAGRNGARGNDVYGTATEAATSSGAGSPTRCRRVPPTRSAARRWLCRPHRRRLLRRRPRATKTGAAVSRPPWTSRPSNASSTP